MTEPRRHFVSDAIAAGDSTARARGVHLPSAAAGESTGVGYAQGTSYGSEAAAYPQVRTATPDSTHQVTQALRRGTGKSTGRKIAEGVGYTVAGVGVLGGIVGVAELVTQQVDRHHDAAPQTPAPTHNDLFPGDASPSPSPSATDKQPQPGELYQDIHMAPQAQVKIENGYLIVPAGQDLNQPDAGEQKIALDGRGLVLKSDAEVSFDGGVTWKKMYDVYGTPGYKDHTGSVDFLLPESVCGPDQSMLIKAPFDGGNLEVAPLSKAANSDKTYEQELLEAVKDQTTGGFTDGGYVYNIATGKLIATVPPGTTDTDRQTIADNIVNVEINASTQYQDIHLAPKAQVTIENGFLIVPAGEDLNQPDAGEQKIALAGRGLVLKSDAEVSFDGGVTWKKMYDVYGTPGYKDHTGSVDFLLPENVCGGKDQSMLIRTPYDGGNLEVAPLSKAANSGKTYEQELLEAINNQTTGDFTDGGYIYNLATGQLLKVVQPGTTDADRQAIADSIVG